MKRLRGRDCINPDDLMKEKGEELFGALNEARKEAGRRWFQSLLDEYGVAPDEKLPHT